MELPTTKHLKVMCLRRNIKTPQKARRAQSLSNLVLACAITILLPNALTAAPGITESLQEAQAMTVDGARSQTLIDQTRHETEQLLQEYRQLSANLQQLAINHRQLSEIHQQQQIELASLETQLAQVTATELDIVPMLFASIDWLETTIANDLPFYSAERQERILRLKKSLLAANISLAERYRRVMEAYQIESEFGYTLDTYRDEITFENQTRQVNMLRVGRLGLYFETLDGKAGGRWDSTSKQWQQVTGDDLKHVKQGILIALKQRPQSLLILPIARR
ncbi:MAG: DUF3450 domain-containing protein [Hahellaceae bacterium]|nr:DUF3450 domain-containing protein [Hahellaceae bacterium]MCP5211477.1 DUF3450 domain-containing protein [Hahellaceae bacterium]